MISTKTTTALPWTINLRPRVGESVTYLSRTWVNKTGTNTVPGLATDWEPIADNSNRKPFVSINGNLFLLDKHPANNDPANATILEANDMIVDGWFNTTTYWPNAIYDGVGDINIEGSWNIINPIEEIPII